MKLKPAPFPTSSPSARAPKKFCDDKPILSCILLPYDAYLESYFVSRFVYVIEESPFTDSQPLRSYVLEDSHLRVVCSG
ncbi:hypothetical protein Naga_100004g163 [Nannochloropsis gaditana]|uniref:Uncharacterized protein n=1 Tax=Nannochloropsis gaditana TaxID=72520 RepID=W7U6D1_9STRA|nr:hypothetical protein Naga_100004g163 [Nannochloropsis gaditana]